MTAEIIKTMKEKIESFLNDHLRGAHPVLLGFSGGGDSLALAYLLHDLHIPVHLAHFDHGWREESRKEADDLKIWAQQMELPFYAERWEKPEPSELRARNARYAFFENLFEKHTYQALVLAHHADDQAETVLKRLLEGAHFHNFKAMQSNSMRGSIPIWRPLLGIFKREILLFLEEKEATYIEDPTNYDLKYLRARMRREILPYLSESFGKNVAPPLARLSEYGSRLSEYLTEKTKDRVLRRCSRGPYYDFRGAHSVEIDFVLSKSPFPTPSHHSLKKIHHAIQKKSRNARILTLSNPRFS